MLKIFVDSKGFSNKVEGWINCDQLELTTSRDEVYEGNEVYTDLLDMSLNTDKDDKILDFHMTYMRTFTTKDNTLLGWKFKLPVSSLNKFLLLRVQDMESLMPLLLY